MSNAILQRDNSLQPVTVLQVDSNLIYALVELNQRLREVQNTRILLENNAMLIEQLKVKLAGFFDKAYANNGNKWIQAVIAKTKELVLGKLDSVKTQMEMLLDSEQFDAGVDFLIDFAKGNVKIAVPWYLRLFVPSTAKLIDDMGVWLKSNKAMFKAQIGDAPPVS
jgi:hypothetical protein